MVGLPSKLLRTRFKIFLFAVCFWVNPLRADHYSGATISYTCLGGNFYTVYLDLYLNCAGVAISSQTLRFKNSCGVYFQQPGVTQILSEEVSPVCASQLLSTTCNGGPLPGFKRYRFSTTVYLSPCNFWTMGWSICCRNTTQNLLGTPGIYAEATLNNLGGVCDNSPRFADNGVPFLCVGESLAYNPGASDPNGNVMSFSLIPARQDSVTEVFYRSGFNGSLPLPGMVIDPNTGQLNFTAVTTGNYVVVIKVSTYNSSGQLIGTVMRDLMFVVAACDGSPPIPSEISNVSGVAATGPSSVAVCQGQTFCADMVVADANPTSIITMASNASVLLPGSTFQVIGSNPATARLCWTANLALLPANIYIDISDGACPIENTASRSIYVNSCLLLPVELFSFNAVPDGAAVMVDWATASEQGGDDFAIERSPDGSVFYTVGRVDAVGESNTLQHYAFKDNFPLQGLSYYRLLQTDTDGSVSFSDMVPVDLGAKVPFQAVYDGSSGWTVVGLPTNTFWALTDALGRTVATATNATSASFHVELGQDRSSMLLFTAWNGATIHTLKLPSSALAGDVVAGREMP